MHVALCTGQEVVLWGDTRKAHSVRMLGNRGVHEEGKLNVKAVEELIFDLKDILTYYAGY